ncbi:MAG TPA: PhzF family phenazine biosynthesis protein [Candidatus Binatia bacterium]|jgi:trans-2,3-dihydro-3-hydroxyanthranilate isomerase
MSAAASSRPSLLVVDVFAEKPYAGNQLAVVVGARADDWPASRMQAFAREMNFSETTFASPTAVDGAFDVRIFTPSAELPFAGHPTLGTAWVLRHFFHASLPASVALRLGIGVVPVEFDETESGELVRMRPRAPKLCETMDGPTLASHLGIDPSDIDPRHPCRRADIGIQFALVPLRNLASLRAAAPKTLPAGEPGTTLGVLAFCPETYEPGGDFAVRMFFEALGVREDPATGSAAACLAAYLSAERWFGSDRVRARLQQGYQIGRPSCLYIGAERSGDSTTVEVAGKVVLVARGEVS